MKNVALFCLIISGFASNRLSGQPTEAVAKEKMKVFSSWAGHWQGEGSIQMGQGMPKKSFVDEYVEFKLDGSILAVEGIGKSLEAENKDKISHHAYAILYFDQLANEYKFNTNLKDGRNSQSWFKILEDNKYAWGFDVPSGKIRYSIHLDATVKTWNEIGEFSSDNGSTWYKFFEMNLKKI
jgi:hypothetical protein